MKVGLLLAAGRSRRFGDADKLTAPFKGRVLVAHAASVLKALPLDHLIAVSATDDVDRCLAGFSIIRNPAPEEGQGRSISLGAQAALEMRAERLIICLGDMPFVPVEHAKAVLERCTDDQASASSDGRVILPPACFPAGWLNQLSNLTGDAGARSLLIHLPKAAVVSADARALTDIDTPADLQ
ncbi:MAG: nucleotidyltransferase family protein [Pseudomonadota bacterium]